MRTSDSIASVMAAFIRTQHDIRTVKKNKSGEVPGKEGKKGYTFYYADLAEVLKTVTEACRMHDIGLIQTQDLVGSTAVKITTRVVHTSGEWFETDFTVGAANIAPQTIGSSASYAKRYAIGATFGIVTERDDNGALGASGGVHRNDEKRAEMAAQAQEKRQELIGRIRNAGGMILGLDANRKSELVRLQESVIGTTTLENADERALATILGDFAKVYKRLQAEARAASASEEAAQPVQAPREAAAPPAAHAPVDKLAERVEALGEQIIRISRTYAGLLADKRSALIGQVALAAAPAVALERLVVAYEEILREAVAKAEAERAAKQAASQPAVPQADAAPAQPAPAYAPQNDHAHARGGAPSDMVQTAVSAILSVDEFFDGEIKAAIAKHLESGQSIEQISLAQAEAITADLRTLYKSAKANARAKAA